MTEKGSNVWFALAAMALATVSTLLASCGGGGNGLPTGGSLDKSFNSPLGYVYYEGTVGTTDVGVESAAQTDGKIIVAGYRNDGVKNSSLLVRFTADGKVDPTFGTGGVAVYEGGGLDNKALGLALSPEGAIVVTGYIRSVTGRGLLVLKYQPDGTLAQQYVYNASSGTSANLGFGVAFQKDGKIVVVGEQTNGATQDIVVLRLLSTLIPDSGFGSSGVVTYNGGGNANDKGFGIAIQSDQKIVVSGAEVGIGAKAPDLLVLRLNSNGSLDSSFGSKGVFAYSAAGDFADYGNVVRIQTDDKIVVGGATSDGLRFKTLLLRLGTGGALDAGFGKGGVVLYEGPAKAYDYTYDIALQKDNKILLSGVSSDGMNNDAVVTRFQANGAIDPTFGDSGVFTFDTTSADNSANAITLQPDGKIVAAGYSYYKGEKVMLLFRLLE